MIYDSGQIWKNHTFKEYPNLESCFNSGLLEIENRQSLLEIGPGIRPIILVQPPAIRILVEPSIDYCKVLQKMIGPLENAIVVNSSAIDFLKTLQQNSIDTIVLSDVIEHLEKDEGKELILELVRVAKFQVLIFTPIGFMPQHFEGTDDSWGFSETNLQTHRSGWLPNDFLGKWSFNVSWRAHKNDLGEEFGAMWAIYKKSPILQPKSALLFSASKEIDRDYAIFKYAHENSTSAIISNGYASKSHNGSKAFNYFGDNYKLPSKRIFNNKLNLKSSFLARNLRFLLAVRKAQKQYKDISFGNLTRVEKIIVKFF
jgi:hypothetical protein